MKPRQLLTMAFFLALTGLGLNLCLMVSNTVETTSHSVVEIARRQTASGSFATTQFDKHSLTLDHHLWVVEFLEPESETKSRKLISGNCNYFLLDPLSSLFALFIDREPFRFSLRLQYSDLIRDGPLYV